MSEAISKFFRGLNNLFSCIGSKFSPDYAFLQVDQDERGSKRGKFKHDGVPFY